MAGRSLWSRAEANSGSGTDQRMNPRQVDVADLAQLFAAMALVEMMYM